jgi:hypothetical protein
MISRARSRLTPDQTFARGLLEPVTGPLPSPFRTPTHVDGVLGASRPAVERSTAATSPGANTGAGAFVAPTATCAYAHSRNVSKHSARAPGGSRVDGQEIRARADRAERHGSRRSCHSVPWMSVRACERRPGVSIALVPDRIFAGGLLEQVNGPLPSAIPRSHARRRRPFERGGPPETWRLPLRVGR